MIATGSLRATLLVPDDSGDYGFISDLDIEEAVKEMRRNFESYGIEAPKFYMIDPLTRMSIRSMDLSNRIWKQFKFAFMPIKFGSSYPIEMQFSKQNLPPEIVTGVNVTKLHVQAGDKPPPEEFT